MLARRRPTITRPLGTLQPQMVVRVTATITRLLGALQPQKGGRVSANGLLQQTVLVLDLSLEVTVRLKQKLAFEAALALR